MLAALVELPHAPTLTPKQQAVLHANGKVSTDTGMVIRPLPDHEPEAPPDDPGRLLRIPELQALREAFAPLAKIEAELQQADEVARDARHDPDAATRRTAPTLAAKVEELKEQHLQVRGTARLAVLGALDAATLRAAAQYTEAAHMLADAAAAYAGLASLRDDLTDTRTFDPLNLWGMVPALLAPDLAHRPRGWSVTRDCYGRELLFYGQSPSHADAIRRTQATFRDELTPVMCAAAWPFK